MEDNMKKVWIPIIVAIVALATIIPISCKKEPKEIKIGAILPLTGDAAKYGEASKNAIALFIDELNASGGIKGKKIKVIYEDDQADPKLGVSAFQKLVTTDKVPVIIGPLPSSVTLAIAPLAEKSKVVILSPASSSPAITNAGDYIFRTVASDLLEGTALANFVYNELKLKKVAIIYINNDFGIGLSNSFSNRFEELGGKIVTVESFEQSATDFRSQLSKIKTLNPQAIYMVGYKEMGNILKQAAELGIKTQFLSFAMFEDPEILKIAGKAAEGLIYSYRSFDPKSSEEVVKKFANNYKSKYGVEPDIFAGLSFDAARILALAIEKGGSNADGIKSALYMVKNFPGVTGEITFDKNGDVTGAISIKTVRQGKFIWYKINYQF
jgi:branched-chain amino acid transport system substrate-binding protein